MLNFEMIPTNELCTAQLTQKFTNMKILSHDPNYTAFTIRFDTMQNNIPSTYGNYIAIWQSEDDIPFDQTPDKVTNIPNTSPSGDYILSGLKFNQESFVIGYSVVKDDGKYNNFCSTVKIPSKLEATSVYPTFQTSIGVSYIGSTSLMLNYITPMGYLPKSRQNWVGLWIGNKAYHDTSERLKPRPEYVVPLDSDRYSGTISFNNIRLSPGETYTAGYFMNGWSENEAQRLQTALACSVTFDTN